MARIRLAMDGIVAYLGNATMVLWCWHYTNAIGGVTLHVRAADADAAARILSPPERQPGDPARTWQCAECGERSQKDWEVCWRCGTSSDGNVDRDFLADSLPEERPGHDPTGDASSQSEARRWRMGGAIARRAYMASVFALLIFPPLVLYSVYLLWRLDGQKTPLDRRATVQYFAAWFLSAVMLLLWALAVGPLPGMPGGAIGLLSRFLNFSAANPM